MPIDWKSIENSHVKVMWRSWNCLVKLLPQSTRAAVAVPEVVPHVGCFELNEEEDCLADKDLWGIRGS